MRILHEYRSIDIFIFINNTTETEKGIFHNRYREKEEIQFYRKSNYRFT